jgi:hypothetical protein
MRPGHDLQAAVLAVDHIAGDPRGHTGAGPHPQIEVVLVQRLPPGTRRLEVEHALRGQDLLPEQPFQDLAQPRVEQHPQGQVVDAVGVHHPRMGVQRVGRSVGRRRAGLEVPGDRAALPQRREPLAQLIDLGGAEQAPHHQIAVLLEVDLACDCHPSVPSLRCPMCITLGRSALREDVCAC